MYSVRKTASVFVDSSGQRNRAKFGVFCEDSDKFISAGLDVKTAFNVASGLNEELRVKAEGLDPYKGMTPFK
jgi:hypothetical protein